ncbi:ferritin-like domain-containing protein [Candidatus Nitrosocosmicus arcticus]|uniref:Ferritin Dps family protein n=1 Tax=Candidatus Nitrosocosmicus arcticus TaxID=2035267 RepID=A0A557SWZ7_9ARCH|nr:ferritin-like domain-containing protein [Candidatus Nitrosocosmicus arcticus]TVP41128.1 Ferritin Dps family protein [Candidatus Nitrosocosmicus arcticus]
MSNSIDNNTSTFNNKTVPTKEDLVNGLNEDLAREYKAIIQYVVFSTTLKGAEYGNIAEQLEKHASDELDHALKVAKQIDYLGGDPVVKGKDAETSNEPKKMLEIDLFAEQETIKNYRERIQQAEAAGEFALSEILRGIITQEQDHEIDLKDALGMK